MQHELSKNFTIKLWMGASFSLERLAITRTLNSTYRMKAGMKMFLVEWVSRTLEVVALGQTLEAKARVVVLGQGEAGPGLFPSKEEMIGL